MKIKRLDLTGEETTVDAMRLSDGTVFLGKIGVGYPRGLYFKGYDSVFCLEDGSRTWTSRSDLLVKEFEEVDAELIIRRK